MVVAADLKSPPAAEYLADFSASERERLTYLDPEAQPDMDMLHPVKRRVGGAENWRAYHAVYHMLNGGSES